MAKSRPSDRSKQLNPQHDSYWQSRGWAARPFMALVDPPKAGSNRKKKRGKGSSAKGR